MTSHSILLPLHVRLLKDCATVEKGGHLVVISIYNLLCMIVNNQVLHEVAKNSSFQELDIMD